MCGFVCMPPIISSSTMVHSVKFSESSINIEDIMNYIRSLIFPQALVNCLFRSGLIFNESISLEQCPPFRRSLFLRAVKSASLHVRASFVDILGFVTSTSHPDNWILRRYHILLLRTYHSSRVRGN